MERYLLVSVNFFSPEEGGRSVALLPDMEGYRPHFRVMGDSEYLGVQFIQGRFALGKPIEAIVCLVYYPQVTYENLVAGSNFEIMEGPRAVGKGTVIGEF